MLAILFAAAALNETLRAAAARRGVFVGAAANAGHLAGDAAYTATLGAQYSLATAENACKWSAIRPSRAVFDYSACDAVYNFTRRYNLTFRGHNLCWGMYNPGWLEHGGFNATAKRALLVEHATAVASYYGPKAYAWDVVNEAISDAPPYALKKNVWYPDVPDYVDVAFTAARSATGAKLF